MRGNSYQYLWDFSPSESHRMNLAWFLSEMYRSLSRHVTFRWKFGRKLQHLGGKSGKVKSGQWKPLRSTVKFWHLKSGSKLVQLSIPEGNWTKPNGYNLCLLFKQKQEFKVSFVRYRVHGDDHNMKPRFSFFLVKIADALVYLHLTLVLLVLFWDLHYRGI